MNHIVNEIFGECRLETTDDAIMAGYKKGYIQALQDYAVWNNGVQTVGCGVKTLNQAKIDFEKEMTSE
jgi:hypothetical protein